MEKVHSILVKSFVDNCIAVDNLAVRLPLNVARYGFS